MKDQSLSPCFDSHRIFPLTESCRVNFLFFSASFSQFCLIFLPGERNEKKNKNKNKKENKAMEKPMTVSK